MDILPDQYKSKANRVELNIEENTFSDMALRSGRDFFVQKTSGEALPELY